MTLKGRWALITGASSGLGRDFAAILAKQGCNLVLTARRERRLNDLAERLQQPFDIEVKVIPADLSTLDACEVLFDTTEKVGLPVDILINNAGFGTHAKFIETEWSRVNQQLQLNMVSLTRMTWLWGQQMAVRGEGWIMNVASVNAYMSIPNYATYAAGKAYVHRFTTAIAEELKDQGVRVTSFCPGPTDTEFVDTAGHKLARWQRQFLMPSEDVAAIGIRSMLSDSSTHIAGWSNNAIIAGLRLLPQRAITLLAGRLMS
ncbi:MAG: SDR family oxidoreductase [Myxococcota bacterium]|nr:SDR family oxidoreductase [Myxococcota bacterium]